MSTYGFTINVAGDSIEQMKKIEASLTQLGVKAGIETKEVESRFGEMGERIGGIVGNLKTLFLSGLGITALFEGWEFIKQSKEEFEALEKAVTKVETVIKSTKYAAGFTSEQIKNQAEELGKSITFKTPDILDAQGMLLSFPEIKGDMFKKTTQAVADFATFFKEDMTSAALQIGKAMNNPEQGMNRLQRQGVAFTNEQKQQIKNYQEQGQLAKAQAIIIGELNREFGGQAAAFALTDAGKIQMAAKEWEGFKIEIGEIISKLEVSLIPTMRKIMESVRSAFESPVVQFFIDHLGMIFQWVMKLLPIWLAYKAVMIANSLITSVFAVENGVLTASMGELTVMTDGTTFAFEGFSAALASTGIGAMVVGIGLLIEKFFDWNNEIDGTVNKLSGIKEINDSFKQTQEATNKINLAYSNFRNLSPGQKSELATDINSQIEEIKNKLATQLEPQLKKTQQVVANANKIAKNENPILGYASLMLGGSTANKTSVGLEKALRDNQYAVDGLKKTLTELEAKKAVVGKFTKPIATGGNAVTDNAFATSALAGAQGGLGEAKVINIHIDTVQRIDKVQGENLDAAAQKAIETIVRTVNNLAYSQSSQ